MYLGKIVELATSKGLNREPLHPYSVALLSAIPIPDPAVEARRRRIILRGDVPSPAAPPAGCRFHTRCWLRERLGNPVRCVDEDPALRELATGHHVACHFAEDVAGSKEQVQSIGRGAPSEPGVSVGGADGRSPYAPPAPVAPPPASGPGPASPGAGA
jgi:peptide/nickel transport system ATP-binding protein